MNIKLGYIHIDSWQPTDRLADDFYFDPEDDCYNEDCVKSVRELDPEEVVLPMRQYVIRLDYPTRVPFHTDLIVNGDGLTRRELVSAIVEAYRNLYKSAKGKNPYGVYGHDIGDLMLASADVSGNAIITVGVDS